MDIEKDSLKKQIREMTQLGYIAPEDLPSIELYMDQVTTFMDKYLSQNKRYEEDKTLTKTMINNYTKNNLLSSSKASTALPCAVNMTLYPVERRNPQF